MNPACNASVDRHGYHGHHAALDYRMVTTTVPHGFCLWFPSGRVDFGRAKHKKIYIYGKTNY